MKKSRKMLTFATALAGVALAATLTACHETVYGPPSGETYNPAVEIPEEVYGPPEVFGLEEEAN